MFVQRSSCIFLCSSVEKRWTINLFWGFFYHFSTLLLFLVQWKSLPICMVVAFDRVYCNNGKPYILVFNGFFGRSTRVFRVSIFACLSFVEERSKWFVFIYGILLETSFHYTNREQIIVKNVCIIFNMFLGSVVENSF